ncbi:DUF2911 domain-containing protein [Persicobacter psychrovividus]|uniref:DUF2911 domain-containing protein n=1 Tax=Persicobacter psychrovividus TaxID=387638 RepID=A0ABN6LIX2_9BACT|nr:hypothetical protein PEPS_38540 [Persicobacter psychrovividus]
MKHTTILGILMCLLAIMSCEQVKEQAYKMSPMDTVKYENDLFSLQITYGRPFKKDRLIFGTKEEGALVPYGEIWRTGANDATEIMVTKDITINGQPVPEGKYSVYTIPGERDWTVAINKKIGYWGKSPVSEVFEPEQDLLRVQVPSQQLAKTMDQFTMTVVPSTSANKLTWVMSWDKTQVRIPMQIPAANN